MRRLRRAGGKRLCRGKRGARGRVPHRPRRRLRRPHAGAGGAQAFRHLPHPRPLRPHARRPRPHRRHGREALRGRQGHARPQRRAPQPLRAGVVAPARAAGVEGHRLRGGTGGVRRALAGHSHAGTHAGRRLSLRQRRGRSVQRRHALLRRLRARGLPRLQRRGHAPSLLKLFALPGETRVLPGHGEETTIARERARYQL